MNISKKLDMYLNESDELEKEFSKLLDEYGSACADLEIYYSCSDRVSILPVNSTEEKLKHKVGNEKSKILAKIRKLREY